MTGPDLDDLDTRLGNPQGPRFDPVYGPLTDADASLIRQWLIAKGVDQTKVYRASRLTLQTAYRVGDRYVERMKQPDDVKRPIRRDRRGFDLEIADPLSEKLGELLDQELAPLRDYQKEAQEARPATPAPLHNPPATAPAVPLDMTSPAPASPTPHSPAGIDAAQIARAAHAVITPRLDAARQEMMNAMRAEMTVQKDFLAKGVDARWTEALRLFETKTAGMIDEARNLISEIAAKTLPRELVVRTETVKRTLAVEARHEAFDRIFKWLLVGEHVYGVGPAGTGKTHLAKQLSAALDKKLWLPGQAFTKYDLSGYKGPTGEYFGTVVRDAIEQGGLLVVDEGDMWAAAALGFLNTPLANGWCSFPDKTIPVHPDFQCVIFANTYGRGATQEYIGRNPLDAASLDRFAYELVDYDENLERLLYGNGPWTQYVQRVRHAIRELRFQHIVSMRATERVNRGIRGGLDPSHVLEAAIWRGLTPDQISKIKSIAGESPTLRLAVADDDEMELSA